MAKIILSIGDKVLREIVISEKRITIGRRPHNDIVIDDLAISGEHAVIDIRNNDSFLEDLNSTNGTQVNGQPVKKHFLQDNDVVQLAQYGIKYMVGNSDCMSASNTQPKQAKYGTEHYKFGGGTGEPAIIKIIDGSTAGKEIALTKILTTLGRPGVQVAVVAKQKQGYYLAHVQGNDFPVLNGESIGTTSYRINNGDVIELGGIKMEFYCARNEF